MPDDFEYISRARLEYEGGYRRAYLVKSPNPSSTVSRERWREYYGGQGGAADRLDPRSHRSPRRR